jgi:hypothetical protein
LELRDYGLELWLDRFSKALVQISRFPRERNQTGKFTRASSRDVEKIDVLGGALARISFNDVQRNRDRGAPKLRAKHEPLVLQGSSDNERLQNVSTTVGD